MKHPSRLRDEQRGTDSPVVQQNKRRYPDSTMAYIMIAPIVIMLSIFVIYPALQALVLSFYNWSFYQESQFVGFKNFTDVLTDRKFRASIFLGLKFVAMTLPVQIIGAFFFASLATSVNRRFSEVLKVSIYIPTIISGVITSVVFAIIYDYSGGVLNAMLNKMNFESQAWLGSPKLALMAIAVPSVWLGMGITCLIMIAGMLDIPQSFYEAAEVEGANWWQKTIYITIPQLKNIFLYLIITGFVASIQQFELPLIMTGGGPMSSTELPNLFIFNHFRSDPYIGYSLAAALLLFVVLGTISALVFRVLNSEKLVD